MAPSLTRWSYSRAGSLSYTRWKPSVHKLSNWFQLLVYERLVRDPDYPARVYECTLKLWLKPGLNHSFNCNSNPNPNPATSASYRGLMPREEDSADTLPRPSRSSIKTGPARKNTARILKNLSTADAHDFFQLLFRTGLIVLISITCSLLPLYFMHEIREIFNIRFFPEISLDKCLTLNSTNISQWNYNSVMKLCLAVYRNCK